MQMHSEHKMVMPMPEKHLKGGRKVTHHLYVKDTLVNFVWANKTRHCRKRADSDAKAGVL